MSWHLAEPAPALVAHPAAASLDEAHAAIELWEFYSRKRLDEAQILAVEHMMAEHADGLWAASSTGRAESRQNGKGDEIEVPELWGLTQRGEAILHTAHEAATAASAHVRLRELILGHRDLRKKLGRNSRGQEAIQSWNGNYRIEMADGAFIVHRTRTSAIGRGLDDISRLVVDEAQHAQAEELASATPILAANPNPQKNYIGSAGVEGKSKFWWRLRREGLDPTPRRFAWLEHSAEVVALDDKGRVVTSLGDVFDRDLWRRANPAYPSRISDDFLMGQLRDLGPEHFAREHLCVWDPAPLDSVDGWLVLSEAAWSSCLDVSSTADDQAVTFAFAVEEDRSAAAIGVSDGRHVELIDSAGGTGWLVPRLDELAQRHPRARFFYAAGPAAAVEYAGDEVHKVTSSQFAEACGAFVDAIANDELRHIGQPSLDASVARLVKRSSGDTFTWDRRSNGGEVAPVEAVTVARFGALTPRSDKPFFGAWR